LIRQPIPASSGKIQVASRECDFLKLLQGLKGRLELTVEAVVVKEAKWHALFAPEELARARARLKEYRYQPKAG
jgi:hypothetical protein